MDLISRSILGQTVAALFSKTDRSRGQFLSEKQGNRVTTVELGQDASAKEKMVYELSSITDDEWQHPPQAATLHTPLLDPTKLSFSPQLYEPALTWDPRACKARIESLGYQAGLKRLRHEELCIIL